MTTAERTAHTVAVADHPHHQADRPEHHAAPGGSRKSWTVLAIALTAQILVVLDISVVNTALPSIGRSLNLRSGDLQWVVTAYLMMSGGGLLLGGRIADLLSRRRVFLAGLTVFTSASILSGFAGNASELIAARAGQGLAAALMTPAALSLIMTTYSGSQRRKGLALWGAVGSMGVAAGVLVGGALTTWAGWQAIFWINGPIGAVTFLTALKVLPTTRTAAAGLKQFDLPGAVTVLGGLMTLMCALGGTATSGWLSARNPRRTQRVRGPADGVCPHRTPHRSPAHPTAHLEGQLTRVGQQSSCSASPASSSGPCSSPPSTSRACSGSPPCGPGWRSCRSRSPSPPAPSSRVTCFSTPRHATSP